MKDFYPSIKDNLLCEAIRFTRRYTSIANNGIEKIFHARELFRNNKDQPRLKKQNKYFHVTMGTYKGAKVFKLFCILNLSQQSKHINKNHIVLYRDDDLSVLRNTSGPKEKKLRKVSKINQRERFGQYCSM